MILPCYSNVLTSADSAVRPSLVFFVSTSHKKDLTNEGDSYEKRKQTAKRKAFFVFFDTKRKAQIERLVKVEF